MIVTVEKVNKLVKGEPVIINKGTGTLSLLGIAFIVLKLTNYINWSWWWVLAPFWIPICLIAVLVLAMFIIYMLSNKVDTVEKEEVSNETPESESTEKPLNTTAKKKVNNKKKVTKNGENAKRKNAEVSQ